MNDAAERGTVQYESIMEEYNTKFTKNEEQKQYLLKVCVHKSIIY